MQKKIVKCFYCGTEIERLQVAEHPECVKCKKQRVLEYNRAYKARRRLMEAQDWRQDSV